MAGKLKGLWTYTPREKAATVDGIGLFFGALLGANMASLEGLNLYDYAVLIFVLAFAVVALRNFSTSERRGYAYGLLGAYVVVVYLFLFAPGPDGLAADDRARLAITLAVWLAMVVMVEFFPAAGEPSDQA